MDGDTSVTGAGEIRKGTTLTVSGDDPWEADFARLQKRYEAEASFGAALEIAARIGVNSWLVEGAAGIEGSASTAWHFGGRIVENGDGTQRTQRKYRFEGLRVRGRVFLATGSTENTQDDGGFDTGSPDTIGTTQTQTRVVTENIFWEGPLDSMLIDPSGSTEWQDV
ncbi:hypothetical protein [Nereida sp. MMG025]|uniref:hypothetical protein n=1 Tax=Nereida sp. MMG025 TaxID=2909981 RepID=UPI001F2C8248|nr:hypothetical protein [Nereida sp. MMG025]MCF6445814.1 hypothetical protein [Nereida sp. MMG025]